MQHRFALPRFLAVGTIGLALNSLLVGALTGPVKLHWLAAQIVATSIVLCWNFGANRVWTFAGHSRPRIDLQGEQSPPD
jgi:putative flippase GtrA